MAPSAISASAVREGVHAVRDRALPRGQRPLRPRDGHLPLPRPLDVRPGAAAALCPFPVSGRRLDTVAHARAPRRAQGITYRTRDEINRVRAARDPLEMQKKRILDNGLMEATDLKAFEKKIKKQVDEAAKAAEADLHQEQLKDTINTHDC